MRQKHFSSTIISLAGIRKTTKLNNGETVTQINLGHLRDGE